MHRLQKKLALVIGCLVLLALLLAIGIGRDEIRAWYILTFNFEHLGMNAQGYREYRHELTGVVFVRLPGATFLMGSPDGEPDAQYTERPQHEVTLSPFLIAKYEVSQARWNRFMGRTHRPLFPGDDLPAEQVTWVESSEFCEKTGLKLPTEAQWEYACRAGTTTRYAFGGSLSKEQANFTIDKTLGRSSHFRGKTRPVESGVPNAFGLHNMHGNVWEYCRDTWDEAFYSRLEARGPDPVCTKPSSERVIRGGGCSVMAVSKTKTDRPSSLRSAVRAGYADDSHGEVGIRPVFELR